MGSGFENWLEVSMTELLCLMRARFRSDKRSKLLIPSSDSYSSGIEPIPS